MIHKIRDILSVALGYARHCFTNLNIIAMRIECDMLIFEGGTLWIRRYLKT